MSAAKIIAERTYRRLSEPEEIIVVRISEPYQTLDGNHDVVIEVERNGEVRSYSASHGDDGWGALDSAFRYARILIERIHWGDAKVMLGDKESAPWL